MDLIAGLQSPTSGTIDINGSGGVGICPQKNVLWDKLTCEEHVYYSTSSRHKDRKDKAKTTKTCSPNAILLTRSPLALRPCQVGRRESCN
ncbi:unnamed protein product [Aureobasidium vineae]|uniref:Uncharacterized protein n=1 Tax=Aureobasidium vineae TaxID=2773715 RepID=A0A9N8JUE0_9PEZI|nr:unnamed protein product [Aureobasidium vineae]